MLQCGHELSQRSLGLKLSCCVSLTVKGPGKILRHLALTLHSNKLQLLPFSNTYYIYYQKASVIVYLLQRLHAGMQGKRISAICPLPPAVVSKWPTVMVLPSWLIRQKYKQI